MPDHRESKKLARRVRMRVIAVKSDQGRCPNGHRVGDEYRVSSHTVSGICIGAFSACLPYLITLRWGGSFPWEDDPSTITVGCPDCENQVVWRLETE